ncbi:MAG: MarR family transcriptional regulator [Clostridia bacterium]|nr:MarR family transcriptional regulator [Clostridia bacterium]
MCTIEMQNAKEKGYLDRIFRILKMRENVKVIDKNSRFNQTELRLLGEIVAARYEGKRYISTQLAKNLGITRSAVSQIVNHLEKANVVKRVPDDVDRKIAYIEITEEFSDLFAEDLQKATHFVGVIVDKMGEDRFFEMCDLFEEFMCIADGSIRERF